MWDASAGALIHVIHVILEDLCTITSGKGVSIPMRKPPALGTLGNKMAFDFALFVYHRWILRVYKIFKDLIQKKKAFDQNPGPPESMSLRDEMFISVMDPEPQASVEYLLSLCSPEQGLKKLPILTSTSIAPLTTNSEPSGKGFRFEKSISAMEMRAQIYFDLCQYFLYNNANDLAKKYVILCRENFHQLQAEYKHRDSPEYLICDIDEAELNGVLLACGASALPDSLMQRFNNFVMNRGDDLIDILRADNVAREIPFVQRKIIELDMEATALINPTKTKEVLKSIVALNTIRSVVGPETVLSGSDFLNLYQSEEDYSYFSVFIQHYLKASTSTTEKKLLCDYLLNAITARDVISASLVSALKKMDFIAEEEIANLKNKKTTTVIPLPEIATQTEWSVPETNRECSNQCLSIMTPSNLSSISSAGQRIERNLITSTNTATFKQLLVELVAADSTVPLWSVNPSWSIPVQLKSILKSLNRGFMQDYSYLLLGKSREAVSRQDFATAVNMLTVLRTEMQRPEYANNDLIGKLSVLVNWEILLVQIEQAIYEWPRKVGDPPALAARCKQCIVSATQNVDGVMPRIKVLEYCGYYLLNGNDLNTTMMYEKRNPVLQLATELGTVIGEIDLYRNGTRKTVPYVWVLVTQMFETIPKRTNPIPIMLLPLVNHTRDGTVFAVLISLLARLHNILKDETNTEILSELFFLWPSALANQNQQTNAPSTGAGSGSGSTNYNIRLVAEVLTLVLQQALKHHPQNVGFLKQLADLELCNGNNETAMRYYVMAVVSASEYCTTHLGRPVIDDVLLRRMIKCCSNMGCHVQAAVLHQFMDEIDYSTAFKCLSEKSMHLTDAMDAYYPCIWDITMLEFIVNMHGRKGEFGRKQQAVIEKKCYKLLRQELRIFLLQFQISYMSQLELNSNNNDEIKREAAAIRKAHFIRALAKQYLAC